MARPKSPKPAPNKSRTAHPSTTAPNGKEQKLSNKLRAFIQYYLMTWNATEAARRAGYSAKTAYSIGWENLRKPEVKAAIEARLKEFAMSADEVLARLARQAGASIQDFLDDDDEFSLDTARQNGVLDLVRKLKRTTRTEESGTVVNTLEVELYDAQAALVQVGRTHGLFVDKVAPTDPSGKAPYADLTDAERVERIAALLERARARGAGSTAGGGSTPA